MKNESLARDIIEHISDAALELAIIRHVLSGEEGDELETERVVMIKSDVVACMTGDDIGCNDPDELDETNCEILWLDKVLTTARKEARVVAFKAALAAVPEVGSIFPNGYEEWQDAPSYRERVIEAIKAAANTEEATIE